MAAVRGVSAASMAAGSISAVLGSTSAKTTFALAAITASAVAKYVLGGMMTSSPSPIPAASRVNCKAAVPELTPIACSVPTYAASIDSKCVTSGPPVNADEASTRSNALRKAAYTGPFT